MNDRRILRFRQLLLLTLLIGYLSIQAHETGHWAVLRVLGSRRTVMGFSRELRLNVELNEALHRGLDLGEALRQLSEQRSPTEATIVLAGAFVAQFGLIAVGFWLLCRLDQVALKETGLLLVLFNSLRVVLYLMRYLQGRQISGDEHMLAFHLGIPEYAVTLPLGLAFAAALLVALREMGRVPNGMVLGWMVLFVGYGLLQMLPRIDDFIWRQIEQGNPLFQPVFGMALPVWVVNGLALLALVITLRRAQPMQTSLP